MSVDKTLISPRNRIIKLLILLSLILSSTVIAAEPLHYTCKVKNKVFPPGSTNGRVELEFDLKDGSASNIVIYNRNMPNRSVKNISQKKDILKIVSEDSIGVSISIKVNINSLTLDQKYSKAGKYNLFQLIPKSLVCKLNSKISTICARECFYENESSCSIHNLRNELKNCAHEIVESKCLALGKVPANAHERGIEIDLLPRHARVGDDIGIKAVSAVEVECI